MQTERPIGSLDELMDGAVAERFNLKLAEVFDNIYDLNTNPKKTRKVVLTLSIVPNERRDACDFKVNVENKLAPYEDMTKTVMLQRSIDGSIIATERTEQIPGQIDIDGEVSPFPHIMEFGASDSI